MINLKDMTFPELLSLQTDIGQEIQKRRTAEEDKLVLEIRNKANLLGLDAQKIVNILLAKRPGTDKPRLPLIYQEPQNHEKAWSGRGRKPLWVLAALKQGKSLDDLLI